MEPIIKNDELYMKLLFEYVANIYLMNTDERKVMVKAISLLILPVWKVDIDA